MEMFANLTVCPTCGNYYNPDNHAQCPICSGAQAGGGFAPANVPAGSFGPTTAPSMARPAAAPAANSFGVTEPVNNPRSAAPKAQTFAPTEAILPGSMKKNQSQAEGQAEPQFQVAPVVGWLFCVEGPMLGNDYRIHAGYNYIGREVGDIHIRGDKTISRERHAKLAYDDESHTYFFGPDEGQNLVRLNGKIVMVPEELRDRDILTIGQTKLMFVALCGETFSW